MSHQTKEKKEHPLSPHLQIYKLQITSALSIFHRMTGVFLCVGALVLGGWLYALAGSETQYKEFMNLLLHPVGKFFLLMWVVSFYYHFCNGIRHLFWDIGLGFELKTSEITGYLTLLTTALLTALTLVAVYMQGGL